MISADLCWEEGEIFDKIVMVFRSSEIRLQLKKPVKFHIKDKDYKKTV